MSGDRSRATVIAGSPPGQDFFTAAAGWPSLGGHGAAIDLPGLSIGFAGMNEEWHAEFLESYGPYACDTSTESGALTLTLHVSRGGPDQYIAPPPAGVETINPVWVSPSSPADRSIRRSARWRMWSAWPLRGWPS